MRAGAPRGATSLQRRSPYQPRRAAGDGRRIRDQIRQLLVADGRELRLYAGTQQRGCRLVTSHNAPVSAIHYNTKGDQFVLVYAASEARIVSNDLGTHADGTLAISQKQILSSAWLDDRQELVTAGSDGTLKYFLTQRHYTVELTGRRLISKLVPRMTIRTEWKWMSHMCADESNGRLFVANEREVLIWHNATGELLQRLPDLHTADMRNSPSAWAAASSRPPTTASSRSGSSRRMGPF